MKLGTARGYGKGLEGKDAALAYLVWSHLCMSPHTCPASGLCGLRDDTAFNNNTGGNGGDNSGDGPD